MSLDGTTADALRLPASPFDSQKSGNLEPGEVSKNLLAQRKRRRNTFGGRTDLADTYRAAKDIIIGHKLFRIAQFAELDGVKQLTICNLWRIERLPDASIRTLEFRLPAGPWEEVSNLEYWPDMPFFPITRTKSLGWWRSIARKAVWKALIAVGYFTLPYFHNEIKWPRNKNGEQVPPANAKKEMSRSRMACRLIERYIGRQLPDNGCWTPGLLDPESMMAGARALRAAFWTHFLDRDVLSAMLAIDYLDTSFLRYLRYARRRPALIKVAAEHRNLLPLLPGINPEQWGRDDLFSRKLWVRKSGRKSTALDRYPVRPKNGQEVECEWLRRSSYKSFEIAAAWRWLSKASSVIVREWAGMRNNNIITNLALANISVKAPVRAYVLIIRRAYRLNPYGVSWRIQQLLRLYLAHCATLWKEQGFAEVRTWLRSNDSALSVMLDYLDAEGFEQGFPDKRSTWTSLQRRSDEWHRRVAIAGIEQEHELLEWVSLVPEAIIDDIVFRPLDNSRSLAIEGYEMRHCVSQYAKWCHQGGYRVYSATEPDGSRSTLGLAIKGRKVILDQHMSKCNGSVSPVAHLAGEQLAAAYRLALMAAKPERRAKKDSLRPADGAV